ncbi:MAG: transketolase [Spirochaetia bacterium]
MIFSSAKFSHGTELDTLIDILTQKARQMRIDIIRMTSAAGSGHVTSAFSATDLVAALYFAEMNVSAENLFDEDRDRFILSKGHGAPVLYAALRQIGIISEENMLALRKPGYPLQGHPYGRTPGVDATTGSLGLGLSQAVGRAFGARSLGKKTRVYAIMSDGECQEGQVWEAAMSASFLKLDNLVAFVDRNYSQVDGKTSEVLEIDPLMDKWRAFGWRVEEINGHSFKDILGFLQRSRSAKGGPSLAVALTKKGAGVSFVQESVKFGHATILNADEARQAIDELSSKSTL